ncbi:MAG: M1 family metallopeptidase [bacterium]|nr:M1 family metallopeptidase [bacterium]
MASNGLLQGTDVVAGGRKRYRWYESYPISVYLVSIAATNYSTWTDYYNHAGGAMPVEFYIYPEDVSTVQPLVADMVQMIETLSDPGCFGEYPFIDEKYGIAQFEGCCGMEHQTMTSQGSFPERRNLHELAHMWWGDSITCETWHDIWLNEGFARYAESLWHEKKPGGSHTAYLDHMQLYRPSTYGGTVYRYDISSSSTIFSVTNSYNKGSWVMHMLRHVIGDADFFDALAAHRVAHEGGAADTEGFRAIVESVYGNDLSWFFQEWVYDPGAPYYRYGWKHRQVGAQHLVLLHVEQYQTTYPNFKMPIDITLNLDGGGNETHVIWHEDDVQWYVLEAGGAVNNVEFDKDTWILRGALQNVPYEASCNDPRGDANGDGHVDLRDFALFQFCYTGAGVTGVYDPDLCACFDRNDDDDIDADDYEVFVGCLDGPTAASDPACDDIPASFADDFDSDTSANWAINTSSSDTAATFAYDYSADGIPSAPRSVGGTTKGVKFESNMVLPAAIAGVTISPVGQSFSGDYTLTLDMWINANGPFPGGGIGSTEFVTAGIGSDGSTVNLHGVSGIGGWFAVDGDGGSSRDYRAYKDAAEQWVASGQYHVDTNNNSGSDLSSYFAAESPPAWQQSNYPQQSGSTSPGCAGFAWHTVTITVDATAGTVRWTIDGLDIATLDRNVGADFSITGNIALGYMDPFSSVSDNAALSFGIIDNVTVAAP